MDHSQIDLKAFALGEGTAAEREAASAHLANSSEAREDFERLQFTLKALESLRDEEMPRRIAFVSDPVFEPSLWQRFWNSGPRLAFAGAGLLACAITAHGFLMRPVAAPVVATAQISQADVDAAVQRAVSAAVQAVDARTENRVRQEVSLAVSKTEKRFTQEIQMMAASFQENDTLLRKQMNRMYVTNAGLSVGFSKE
jgi:anti-sigma factor RsiW